MAVGVHRATESAAVMASLLHFTGFSDFNTFVKDEEFSKAVSFITRTKSKSFASVGNVLFLYFLHHLCNMRKGNGVVRNLRA